MNIAIYRVEITYYKVIQLAETGEYRKKLSWLSSLAEKNPFQSWYKQKDTKELFKSWIKDDSHLESDS